MNSLFRRFSIDVEITRQRAVGEARHCSAHRKELARVDLLWSGDTRHSGAAGMHPCSCWTRGSLGCKQWRKSCIVAARIVSRKAVTLSSGSCVPPALPPAASRTPRHPPSTGSSRSRGGYGPPIPAAVSAEKANSY